MKISIVYFGYRMKRMKFRKFTQKSNEKGLKGLIKGLIYSEKIQLQRP